MIGPGLWHRAQSIPRWLLRPAAGVAARMGRFSVNEDGLARRLASRLRLPVTALDKIAGASAALADSKDIADFYSHFICTFPHPGELMLQPVADARCGVTRNEMGIENDAEWMMAMDSRGYLPGDILVKVDRAAMSTSLETRAPLLDGRAVAMAWRLPLEARIHEGQGKYILRDILYRHVPRDLVERPKQGFAIPLDHWLRGALRGWAEAMLGNGNLFRLAGLNSGFADRLWKEHQSGRANHGQKLWTVLMFLAWLARFESRLAA